MAWIANQQDHHPIWLSRFNRCVVAFSTYDSGGITPKDLVCAARVDALET
jgi:4a-hydroxytetrahydrobiopterin dehydratase